MKINKLFITLGLLFGLMTLQAQDNVVDEVIAVVGADPILKSDIEEQFKRLQAQGVSYTGDLKCKLLEDRMIQKLLLNQAKLDSLEVSESDIIESVDRQINYYISQIGSKEKLEEYFDKSIIQIKENLRDVMREEDLTRQMQKKLTENITTTPSEIRKFYNSLPSDSIPVIPAQYEVEKIEVKPKIEKKEIERVKAQLREFRDRVNNGFDFSTLAILYSQDKLSARRGGELGLLGRGELVPEFANVAFNLRDPKKVSKVVETEYGFHIMQLIERTGNRVNVRHILLKPQISDSARQNSILRLDSITDFIHEGKFNFEKAALYYSEDDATRSNGGLMANPATGASKFEITQLPQEIAKTVQTLQVDSISQPFKMIIEKTGQEVYLIIKLKSRIDAHKANLKDDYQVLKEEVLAKKKEEKLKEWVKEQQLDTYISIDEKWRNCEFEYPGWVK
ncbi:peptidylprolyl isomerase [Saccharicrinis sp. FJH2]|uniref:peptidylprolyl isomerase n=1 Tax=Saccharicrinis sp. FJH65 TaxID=3344659 RepID=UPI0035F448C1